MSEFKVIGYNGDIKSGQVLYLVMIVVVLVLVVVVELEHLARRRGPLELARII